MRIFYTLSLLFCIPWTPVSGQNQPKQGVNQIQPTIMVVPFIKANEDLRTLFDSSIVQRVVNIKVQEAFDNRGFTTIDFRAKLEATKTDQMFKTLNQSDHKTALIEGSGADIYIEVETNVQKTSGGTSVRLNMVARDPFTGRLLGSKTVKSNQVFTDQYDKLAENALNKQEGNTQVLVLEDLLNVMQQKFDDMIENGRPVKVIFTIDPNSSYNFDSEVGTGGDELQDVIDDWFEEHAVKGNYHQQGATERELLYDEVRIPLRDAGNKNYTPKKFAREIRKFVNTITNDSGNFKVDDDFRGGTIYITLK